MDNYEQVSDLIMYDNNWPFDDIVPPLIQEPVVNDSYVPLSNIESIEETISVDSYVTSSLNIASDMYRFIARPYPPFSVHGSIHDHDQPYAHFGHLDNNTICHQYGFDLLGEKTTERRHTNNDRLSRQTYAITCRSQTDLEPIMHEILRQFPIKNIQYVCVSSDYSEIFQPCRQIYIQIILTKVMNKMGWFLDEITGDQCNYHVTENDLAWNEFSKKNRIFYEYGQFRSRRRARTQSNSWATSPFLRAQQQI